MRTLQITLALEPKKIVCKAYIKVSWLLIVNSFGKFSLVQPDGRHGGDDEDDKNDEDGEDEDENFQIKGELTVANQFSW